MIKHTYNKDIQVLEVIYEGHINSDEIISHTKYIATNKELPRNLKIITDARNAIYDFDDDTVSQLKSFLKVSTKNYITIKDAFLHKKPRETAYSLLMESETGFDNYFHKVFLYKRSRIKMA